jgi:predicted AlkP superfamily phosphohydrolase/phosphomutase
MMGVEMNKEEIWNMMDELRIELAKIESEEKREKNSKLVGKYFKKDNVYYKVKGLNDDFDLDILTFEMVDGLNNNEGLFASYGYDWMPTDTAEVDYNEFYSRWLEFLTRINMVSI